MARFLRVFGAVLVLGGLAHSVGVANFYRTGGLPEANRILIDIWIAEAQLLAGALYWAASQRLRRHEPWRLLGALGVATTAGFTIAMLPVVFARDPLIFRIPAIIYLIGSLAVLSGLVARWDKPPTQAAS